MAQPAPWQELIGRRSFKRHLSDQRAFNIELSEVLRDAANEADRIVTRMAPDPNSSAIVRRAQYKQVSAALKRNNADLFADIGQRMKQGLVDAGEQAVRASVEIADYLGDGLISDSLADSLIAAARHSAENVRSRMLTRIDLSPRVYRTRALTQRWVDRAVNRGIALNKSAAEIARDVRKLISPNTPGGVSFAARRLARTELNNAFHATTLRTAVNQPWVDGIKWNLSGSHPRADECDDFASKDHDGLGKGVFKPNNTPGKPHPQCLCYTTTVTVEPDEFIEQLLNGQYDTWLARSGIPSRS